MLIDMKQKESASFGYWVNYVALNLDLFDDLDLEFSGSNFEVALSQALLVLLMWNKKEANRVDTGPIMLILPLTAHMTLAMFFKIRVWNSFFHESVDLFKCNERDVISSWLWPLCEHEGVWGYTG